MDQAHSALTSLNAALIVATNCGALDLLYEHCKSPDSINDVCDSLDEALKQRQGFKTMPELLALWAKLGDVPVVYEGDDVFKIEEEFLHFSIGTLLGDIWHWFESQNPNFLVGEVMNGKMAHESKVFKPKPETPLALLSSITIINCDTTAEQAKLWALEMESLYNQYYVGNTEFTWYDMHGTDWDLMIELEEIVRASTRPPLEKTLISNFGNADWRNKFKK